MSVLDKIIGLVAPSECISCGAENHVVCEACATAEIIDFGEHCAFCNRHSPGSRTCIKCRTSAPRFVWVTSNYENLARDLISKYKFGQLRAAADDIASLMANTFFDFNEVKGDYLVVAVPTATSRRRDRGFDHAQLLANKVATALNLPSAPALGRLGQSRQLGARRELRIKQADGKYYVRLPNLIKNRNILLVDDVITTGATLKAVTKTLRRAGAKQVNALVFAKRL